mmetsp:Transcript_26868/g.37418  ORF Transcript_26868/g.37418 Transcript_26868/m.37418 type:complete len:286 (-) Transcript_26868:223-1080(-)|eukprot:CAMPEP_0201491106 /NCGR_PEP_ID=MMETSP0151_2-20130828/28592_1 /ASSEMBLY_ACC=CAM_ASM_000257 /TAXON_ID=200890 /ORGANISM="Paramoeba atlantica, Strain 621/1 / CCAP 1560/9" /LENGTH=285 /DNA_ID=CAMNT_0047877317 /DNA_START=93 /DNA_END=950 /DNA_ORIENTATION=-
MDPQLIERIDLENAVVSLPPLEEAPQTTVEETRAGEEEGSLRRSIEQLIDLVSDLNVEQEAEQAAQPIVPKPQSPPAFKRVTEEKEPEYPNNAVRQIMKELKEMNSVSFGEGQVRVQMKSDDPFSLSVILTPNDGLYKDGEYTFDMSLTEEYPTKKPTVSCPCQIFHPNVSYSGSVCFSLLSEDHAGLRIADFAHGLLWLLYYPNLYSRMNSDCPRDEREFAQMVRKSIEGGEVSGHTYKRSPQLPPLEEKKEEKGDLLKGEKNGKCWVWKLVGQNWEQVFEDPS